MIFERMSLGEAKRAHDYLQGYKGVLLINNAELRYLSFIDILIKDLEVYTNDFRHDYGFTVLKR